MKCHLLTTVHQCIAVCVWNPKYRPNLKIEINTSKECKTWNITCELFQILLFIFSLKKEFSKYCLKSESPILHFLCNIFQVHVCVFENMVAKSPHGKVQYKSQNDTHKTSWWLDLLNSKHEIKHDNTYLVWNLTIECA